MVAAKHSRTSSLPSIPRELFRPKQQKKNDKALAFLAPQLVDLAYNDETRDDICETLMSFAFMAEHSESTSGMVAISKLRDLIDMVRWVTFRLPKSVGSERFLEWAKWIQDIAAYRSRKKRARMQ